MKKRLFKITTLLLTLTMLIGNSSIFVLADTIEDINTIDSIETIEEYTNTELDDFHIDEIIREEIEGQEVEFIRLNSNLNDDFITVIKYLDENKIEVVRYDSSTNEYYLNDESVNIEISNIPSSRWLGVGEPLKFAVDVFDVGTAAAVVIINSKLPAIGWKVTVAMIGAALRSSVDGWVSFMIFTSYQNINQSRPDMKYEIFIYAAKNYSKLYDFYTIYA